VTWHPGESMAVVLNVDDNNFGNPRISGFGGVLRRMSVFPQSYM